MIIDCCLLYYNCAIQVLRLGYIKSHKQLCNIDSVHCTSFKCNFNYYSIHMADISVTIPNYKCILQPTPYSALNLVGSRSHFNVT